MERHRRSGGTAAAALVALAVASSGAGPPAPHWPVGYTIPVWIDPSHAPPSGLVLVRRALAAWTAAADRRFALAPAPAPDEAPMRVRFAPGDRVYGEASPRMDPRTSQIVFAEVMLANDPSGDRLTQRITIYLTALHEIGHALGLPHRDDFTSIMYRFRRPDDGERFFNQYRRLLRSADDVGGVRATGLSQEDVRALRALYDARP